MIIHEMADSDRAAWDDYVRTADGGLPNHLSGWRDVMTNTYGYDTCFLMAKENEAIVGVLPMFFVRSFLVGNRAMTMPGGLCADSDAVAQALLDRGMEASRQARVKRLVLQDSRRAWPGELHTTSEHVHWLTDVRAGSDALWAGLRRNTRRQVRLARKNGVTFDVNCSSDVLGDFYDVLSHFTHEAGTPVFGQSFLEHVVEAFSSRCNIGVTYFEDKPVGGYFQLVMGNTVYGVWGATLRDYLPLRATYLAYWELIHHTATNGYDYMDMGRSPAGSNVSGFKKKWGGVSFPVYQQIVGLGEDQPAESVTERLQSDSAMQRFMRVWPKLPFSVTQFLGPKLRYHVPFA